MANTKLSAPAKKIYTRVNKDSIPKGEIKKLAKEIKKDHELAMELWHTGEFQPRLLAVLIMDKALLTQDVLDALAKDVSKHPDMERNYITEWLMANQLMKSPRTIALLESWQDHSSPIFRRLFWYHQARLRWVGQTPPENTATLVKLIKKQFATEDPQVQWAMNMCAGWIGVHDKQYRAELVKLGEKIGLYKEEKMVPNCTPNYLPKFIEVEVGKLT